MCAQDTQAAGAITRGMPGYREWLELVRGNALTLILSRASSPSIHRGRFAVVFSEIRVFCREADHRKQGGQEDLRLHEVGVVDVFLHAPCRSAL
mgnify:CR=1 FL=1